MLTYDQIGKQTFPGAINAAQNLATKFGIDLPNASKLVGRALEDPSKGLNTLSRYIGQLSPQLQQQVKDMQATGNVTGAQTILLDALNSKMGGSAATAATTFQGKMDQLKNKLEDVRITIGTHLINALSDLENMYTKHTRLINDLAVTLGILIGVFAAYEVIMKTVKLAQEAWTVATEIWQGVTKAATLAQAAFNAVMYANPIALVIIAIVAIIAIGVLLITHWKEVSKVAKQVWDDVAGFFTGLWHDIEQIFDSIVKAVEDHFALILAVITGPVGLLVYFVTSHFQQILNFIEGIGRGIVNAVSGLDRK